MPADGIFELYAIRDALDGDDSPCRYGLPFPLLSGMPSVRERIGREQDDEHVEKQEHPIVEKQPESGPGKTDEKTDEDDVELLAFHFAEYAWQCENEHRKDDEEKVS